MLNIFFFRRHCVSPISPLQFQTSTNKATLTLSSGNYHLESGGTILRLDYSAVRLIWEIVMLVGGDSGDDDVGDDGDNDGSGGYTANSGKMS